MRNKKENAKKEFEEFTVDSLLEVYEEAVRLHGVYTDTGDYKKGNLQYYRLVKIYAEIRRRGLEAQKAILSLLNSRFLGVKVWTAYHALEFAPEIAEPVLSEIAKNPRGIQALNAEMTLREWRAGNLKF